ncbi:potassium transporter Kup [Pseudoxanthomonas mexicana]|jgi:KUP system potassium uptake protein|uniref:Probable potassium transport system protein Kup n=2 Tax=Pseudoxanthomonas TaxID=83618 RepID=A0ABX6RB19_PSEMX|nr:potassium transporter Kup [Pseudoxanthomonas sp.]MBP7656259.1 potassium transporter Kup [Pseudoxanthomonas sp.]MCP1585039.1 KUP system potassium uptake protein [Pseudoxanthomonas mexicana]QND80016.1 potassium transporter Kup [Pseudoxanthomonas mexicana]
MSTPSSPHDAGQHGHSKAGMVALVAGAVGVVFGDIGTSPLYTIKEMFHPHFGLTPDADTVRGLLSLGFWSLLLVVTLKYVIVIMRADNDGEGGIMALTALAQRSLTKGSRLNYTVGILGIFGAALFFGDGMITPPITVLGAVEGLEVVSPVFTRWVVPISLVILTGLFAFQRFGTAKVGKAFGPVMITWFIVLAGFGIYNIAQNPSVLAALNPFWAWHFFVTHDWHAVLILGAVVLTVTGGEALYADMGHFGKKPIRWGWFGFVLPALVLNYYGQGAVLLRHPEAVANPFYMSIPDWAQIPMLVLATTAAAVASQAVITGAFSVTRQAIQLGYLPRLHIKYTSKDTIGQIYVPSVNLMLYLAVVVLVLSFQSSGALATAYGLSVTGTMLIDTLLLAIVAYTRWPDSRRWVLPLCGVFLVIDLAFLFANGAKLVTGIGAWVPLFIGITAFTMMRTWRRGRELLHGEVQKDGIRLDTFLPGLMLAPPVRVPGTAIFLTADKGVVPHALLHNLKHNKVLHERNVFLTVETMTVPYAPKKKRLKIEPIGDDFYRVVISYGFAETPDVPQALMGSCDQGGVYFDPMETTYFASRETVVARRQGGMPIWRDKLFAAMHRNAAPATGFFRIPGNRLVELGAQVEI